ncbi:MAG TPA: hypothetical protein PLC33_13220, partial [Niabella sp.]|nr:hypothetical protein [Niabella sp.]
ATAAGLLIALGIVFGDIGRLTLIGRPFFTEVIGGADGVLAGTAVAITNNSMLGILLSFHSTIKEKRCGTM